MKSVCERKIEYFSIPICVFVFKRVESVKMIFEVLNKIKPTKIYVFADGPRDYIEGENEKVGEVREYIDKAIHWKCEKYLYYYENNKGCDRNIVEGMNIFFSKEEMGIIFEDDAVPVKEFFPYCEYLLNKFQRDKRIQFIAGFNAIGDNDVIREDYSFGKTVPLSGAFATWADRWNNCDFSFSKWSEYKKTNLIKNILYIPELRTTYNRVFDELYNGKVEYWDYKFDFDMFIKDRCAIVPRVNMATSYGYMEGAFHPQEKRVAKKLFKLMKSSPNVINLPLKEPIKVQRNTEYDKVRQKLMLSLNGNIIERNLKKLAIGIKNIIYLIMPKFLWKKIKYNIH